MSVHEIRLPSPPPDPYPRGSMSRLFNQSAYSRNQAEILSDANGSDVESAIRKKVGFHPWTTNILEPQLSTPDSEVAPSLKSLPPSRDCQINSRPILKATASTESGIRFSGDEEKKSHVDMMDSLLNNLDVGDRSASTDAYQAMISLIRNYEEPPESELLQAKMTKLQLYIKRDLVVLDNSRDSNSNEERLGLGNLVASALKVLVTMVWSPVYSPCLTDDFCIWAVDRAINVLKEHTAAKAVLLHYMHLIATQNFRSSLFTNGQGSRTVRILEALQDLTDHVSGKAVIAERLLVYEKLMNQAKQVMERKVELWMKNLLTAMGHSFKEVRKNALSAGTKACNVFADSHIVASAARQALAEDTGERSVSASITNKLEKFVAAKEDVNQIPQLWTVVLMLCNNSRTKLDTWSQVQLHEWLKLIQRCFNSSDPAIHVQALMAWNRLYYIARPYEASDKIVSMLAKPAMKKMDATGSAQSSKGIRQAVISSFCMLLYYAFRPSLTHPQITRMWNEFIVKTMTSSFLSKNTANCDLSCRILSALFYSALPASRIWNERRAQENAYLDPLELPAIDSKWVRSHAISILAVLKLLVQHSSFGPDGAVSEQAYAAQCWRNFNKAIRESSNKEIVPSAETKIAQQNVVDFLASQSLDTELWQSQEPRLILLAKITVNEFTVPSLLQTLESSSQTHISIVLQELVRAISKSIERNENTELNRKALQRCLKLLQQSLEQNIAEKPSRLGSELKSTYMMLNIIPTSEAQPVLEQLQAVLVDALQVASSNTEEDGKQFADDSTCVLLASAIFDLLTSVSINDYRRLDMLLSSLMLSRSLLTQQKATSLQTLRMWRSHMPDLGTNVAQIISTLRSENSSPVNETASSTNSKSKSKNTFLNRLKQSATEKRPRHDDSQIEFVSIESSPPQSIQFESQFLTDRQKEVRARQDKEPAITFADIRSSPSHSIQKAKSALRNAAAGSPQLPNTPPLPRQQHEDESETPTPTPKARKTLQHVLQPDVPSSPPSVIGVDTRGPAAAPITSSPMKEVAESDDAVQLSTIEEEEIAETIEQETRPPTPPSRGSKQLSRDINKQLDYFGKAINQEIAVAAQSPNRDPPSTNENYETAPAASSSPVSYSDEDDAMAASQLSQNLLQEGRSVSVQSEMIDRGLAAQKKRKRAPEDSDQHAKKRKGSQEENEPAQNDENTVSDQNDDEGELSDCIVVDTSFARPLNWRSSKSSKKAKTKKKNGTGSPASSQRSQRSSTGTPASQKSTASRKRRARGSGRLTRSQTSQVEDEAETQVSTSEQQDAEEVLAENQTSHQMDVSLQSEVEETPLEGIAEKPTPSSQPLSPSLQQLDATKLPPDIDTAPKPKSVDGSTTDERIEEAGEPLRRHSSQQGHEAVGQVFDPIQSLQSILDTMSSQENVIALDLAAIHNLCFKIGLKAQQLVTQD